MTSGSVIRGNPPSLTPEATGPTWPAGWQRATAHDLLAPLLVMYAGQLLIGVGAATRIWGVVAVFAGLLLLAIRIRKGLPGWIGDALQIALALALCLLLALDLNGFKGQATPWTQIQVWALACALAMMAVLNFRPAHINLGLPKFGLDRWDLLAIVMLLAGSFFVRTVALDTLPLGFDPDEGSFATFAADAASGAARDPFATGWATHPTLQFFFNAPLVKAFGRGFLAMRLPAAILGTLAVAAIYLFARVGFGRRVAIVAGVLAMSSDVLVQFSRLGINNISDALFMAWTLAALWAAGSTGRPAAYVAAGVGLGLGQYYYFGARAIPFVVAAQVLVWIVADLRGVLRSWHLLAGGLLVTIVVSGPLLGHWLRSPGSMSEHLFLTVPFSAHMREQAAQLGITQGRLWWQHVADSLAVFTILPDRGSFYHPPQPLLPALLAPFFLLGTLVALVRSDRPIYQGLLASVLITLMLGSVLMNDPAAFHRLLGIMPAVLILVAVAVTLGADLLGAALKSGADPRVARRTGILIAAGGTVLMAMVTLNFYFRTYPATTDYKPPNQEGVSVAALEFETAAGKGAYFLCTADGVDASGKVYHTPLTYVAGDRFKGCVPELIEQAAAERPLHFYFLTDQFSLAPQIEARFPGGTYKEYGRRSDGLTIMIRYLVTQ